MPIVSKTVIVTSSSNIILFTPSGGGSLTDTIPVIVFNNDTGVTCFIGSSSQSSTDGLPVPPRSAVNAEVFGQDALWGISTSVGGIDVRVMTGRR